MKSDTRIRFLIVYQLIKNSGKKGINVKEIIEHLQECGIFCDRRAIYTDFDFLLETNEPFYRKQTRHNQSTFYYLEGLNPRYDRAPWEVVSDECESEISA